MKSTKQAIGKVGFYDQRKKGDPDRLDFQGFLVHITDIFKGLIGRQIISRLETVATKRVVNWLYPQITVLSLFWLAN